MPGTTASSASGAILANGFLWCVGPGLPSRDFHRECVVEAAPVVQTWSSARQRHDCGVKRMWASY